MRIKIYIILILAFYYIGPILAQEEELRLVTYYPPPYGVYTELRANFYRDLEDTPADGVDDPLTYFMDLDARSWLRRLAIGVDPSVTAGLDELNILRAADEWPLSSASSYVFMGEASSNNIYSSVYGEAYNVAPTTVNNYLIGIYGKCTGTNSDNKGVYGDVGDSIVPGILAVLNPLDFGVYGIGDDFGVRGRGDICGAYAYFGESGIPQPSGIYVYARDTWGGAVGHGVYGKTTSSPSPDTTVNNWYYGGYFTSSYRGVYAYSDDEVGLYGETDSNDRYGGMFVGSNVGLEPGGGVKISVTQGDNKPEERPEITGNDDTLTIRLSDSLTLAGTYYGSRVTVIADGKDSLAGIAAKQNSNHNFYPSIYLKSIWPDGTEEAATKHILSSRAMEFKPGMADLGNSNYTRIYIIGSVYVGTSDVPVHSYGDLAEVFELKDKDALEQGDVVVIDEEGKALLKKSAKAYDDKIAGVISSVESASMVMGFREDGSQDRPLALRGRVLCNVDAGYGEIKPGDLLTSSPTPGHAMKAEPIIEKDGRKIYGQGVILGKALESLEKGKGKILIIVCLM